MTDPRDTLRPGCSQWWLLLLIAGIVFWLFMLVMLTRAQDTIFTGRCELTGWVYGDYPTALLDLTGERVEWDARTGPAYEHESWLWRVYTVERYEDSPVYVLLGRAYDATGWLDVWHVTLTDVHKSEEADGVWHAKCGFWAVDAEAVEAVLDG